MSEKTLHVLYQADENYAVPMCISMYSLLEKNTSFDLVYFHIINNGLSEKSIKKIVETLSLFSSGVDWIDGKEIERKLIELDVKPQRDSYTTYMKLFVINRIYEENKGISNLLYLDCDTLIVGDIGDLKKNLENKDAAAVYEFTHTEYREHLGLLTNSFNAGVILFNVINWNKYKYEDKIVSLLQDREYVDHLWLHDQDILNYIFKDKLQILAPAYNMNHSFYLCHKIEKYEGKFCMAKPFYSRTEVEDGIKNPKVIHYMDVCWTGMPWDKWNANKWSGKYKEIKKLCWPEGKTISKEKTLFRKIVKTIIVLFHKVLPRSMRAAMYYRLSKYVSARNMT